MRPRSTFVAALGAAVLSSLPAYAEAGGELIAALAGGTSDAVDARADALRWLALDVRADWRFSDAEDGGPFVGAELELPAGVVSEGPATAGARVGWDVPIVYFAQLRTELGGGWLRYHGAGLDERADYSAPRGWAALALRCMWTLPAELRPYGAYSARDDVMPIGWVLRLRSAVEHARYDAAGRFGALQDGTRWSADISVGLLVELW